MNTPQTRAEFEHNFHLLSQQLTQGKLHYPSGYAEEGLTSVRHLPNGRIDFLSVNEMARLAANSSGHFSGDFLKKLINDEKKSAEEKVSSNPNDG